MTAPAPSTPPRRDPAQAERLLQRLDWQVIRRLDGLLQGDHRALFYGSGTDFADLREYQPQDDVRYIDWNVTARLDVALRAPVHRRPRAHRLAAARPLVVDGLRSRRTHQGRRARGAGRHARSAAHAATATASARCSTTTRSSASSSRGAGAGRSCGSPVTCCASRPVRARSTDLSGLFRAGLNTIRRRSLVFVISDFISEPGWERTLGDARAAPRGRRDPPLGLARGRAWSTPGWSSCRTPRPASSSSSTPATRGSGVGSRKPPRRAHEQLRSAIRRAGVDLYDLSTDDDIVRVLLRMVSFRKRRGHR